ncbi:MAG: hypothetical protein DWQ42_02510 [Planctomycetota bacterium]|nr:MAG: hypothetical protein DWQ42_02510 [Planctomycetota bacterium]REK43453.1 MAG: hypothetical protein DWQ46_11115 [Planctomycetota bacterium]
MNDQESTGEAAAEPDIPQRRNFFAGLVTIILGAIAGLVPIGAGLAVLFDPLRRRNQDGRNQSGGDFVRITTLKMVNADGLPQRFPVIKDRVDHFSRFPEMPVGMVYLRQTGPDEVVAFQADCPHLGCKVDFLPQREQFSCPCHASYFELDGTRIGASPSPRSLDTLDVEIRTGDAGEAEVWVRFEEFKTGEATKISK